MSRRRRRWCRTCHRRPPTRKGECATCYAYRLRTGRARPMQLIYRHFLRRAG